MTPPAKKSRPNPLAEAPPALPEPDTPPKDDPPKSFRDLGVIKELCDACDRMGFASPRPIQIEAIPFALEGRDIIGIAETGSGKTAAFALPMLQALIENPAPLFGLILAPTRELANQIKKHVEGLGAIINVRCVEITGGTPIIDQAKALQKSPHVVVATPGRLVDHLENTKGFHLRNVKYLVFDEADKLLDLNFSDAINKILKVLPRERRTHLFSATLSDKVGSLQRASLRNPVKVSASSTNIKTVKDLVQRWVLTPAARKDLYLVHILRDQFADKKAIVFARTIAKTQELALLLRALGFSAIPMHGDLPQSARNAALARFVSGERSILVATDVAARGLDIRAVDLVLNYDVPDSSDTYVHRVGRTARAGKAGQAVSLVTQYDAEVWLRLEAYLGGEVPKMEISEDVMVLADSVGEAQVEAKRKLKEALEKGRRKGGIGHGKQRNDHAQKRRYDDREEK
jgi:ATP-dependent RNA helicase DDX47/RRP3